MRTILGMDLELIQDKSYLVKHLELYQSLS